MAFSGQQTTTTTAAKLPAAAVSSGPFTLKAPKANTAPIAIGGAGVTLTNGHIMDPGDSVQIAAQNLNTLYLVGANTADKITWIGV